jgi:HlyD family secretion protein
LPLRIALGSNKKTLILPAGAYYQSSGGAYVYVLENEQTAHKRKVQLGRQNPEMIEVISGLSAGERIISSSYRHFENAPTIHIKP